MRIVKSAVRPARRPTLKGRECVQQHDSFATQRVAGVGHERDDAGVSQLSEPLIQHARRHRIAAGAERTKDQRRVA